jgi:cytochrome c553
LRYRLPHPAICCLVVVLAAAVPARAGDDGIKLFTDQVRPLLLDQCVKCHGGEKIKGELDMTTREGLLHPGENGPAIVPGKSRESRLMKLIRHADDPHMPEKKPKLSDESIEYVARWIDAGAQYDKPLISKSAIAKGHATVTPEDKKYWAFVPLNHSPTPTIKDEAWCRTPIDHFILSALEAKGIAPNPTAEKRKLIRRASLDLIGLPPTPQEVQAFLQDESPHAYENLVDRLLASPHFGERWARHWLDVARFAESHGYEQDYDRPYAYHYRDFVIRAFNDDLPYDTFVKWQLAGDELKPNDYLALAATGFLGAGTHATQITANQAEKERYDELDDIANTTGTAFLGLTVGCARCHDHKFDPIPSKDYYRLISTFTTTVRGVVVYEEGKPPRPQPTTQPDGHYPATRPSATYMMVCGEGIPAVRCHTQGPDFYPKTYFCKRGDVNQKEGEANQGFLTVLENSADGEKHWEVEPPPGAKTSYRRTTLANWITDTEQGAGHLLARVIVNRLWQHHFGRGFVATPNDFGVQGEKPTHPELLDYLASELLRNGWRLKPIHRLIMTSSVYMQDNAWDEARNAADPDNLLLWRRAPQRLEAEAIRDSMLAVSGKLDSTMYGPGTLDEGMNRRSIYFFVKRSRIIPLMLLFDAPNALTGMGSRATTTVAPQALVLMNNPQVQGYAKAFAERLAGKPAEDAVRAAYEMAFCREPKPDELADAVTFLRDQAAQYQSAGRADAATAAMHDFCQALLSLNEFVYVD